VLLVLAGMAAAIPGSLLTPNAGVISTIVANVALAALPIAVGLAILRYRLFDIDRIISRTISWGLTTGLIGALFAGLIVALQGLLAPVTGGDSLAVATSTLAAAAVLQPVRRSIQTMVDYRFNRRRYDSERIVGAYAAHLRGVTDLGEVQTGAVDAASRALNPRIVSVWIRNG
jgi:hypothetical protein